MPAQTMDGTTESEIVRVRESNKESQNRWLEMNFNPILDPISISGSMTCEWPQDRIRTKRLTGRQIGQPIRVIAMLKGIWHRWSVYNFGTDRNQFTGTESIQININLLWLKTRSQAMSKTCWRLSKYFTGKMCTIRFLEGTQLDTWPNLEDLTSERSWFLHHLKALC